HRPRPRTSIHASRKGLRRYEEKIHHRAPSCTTCTARPVRRGPKWALPTPEFLATGYGSWDHRPVEASPRQPMCPEGSPESGSKARNLSQGSVKCGIGEPTGAHSKGGAVRLGCA